MNPFLLMIEALPMWHDMAFEAAPEAAIVVRTHPRVHDAILDELSAEKGAVSRHMRIQGFGAYAPPSDPQGWGFPRSGNRLGGGNLVTAADGWTRWRFPLPQIGYDDRERADLQSALAVSATLSVFFDALKSCVRGVQPEALGPDHQLMLVTPSLQERALHAAPISAIFSPETIRRMPQIAATEAMASVTEAMRTACQHLWGAPLNEAEAFETRCDPPEDVHLRIPFGNAVGLSPRLHGRGAGLGYELDSHNVDMPFHQLTLLAGLARLHERLERAH